MTTQPAKISKILILWYKKHKRDLAWRKTNNPYLIWLSEIILQQTRVEQGTGYYLRFARRYPSVNHLARAPIDQVLKMWQGLGYYNRARYLHHTAKTIAFDLKGVFPDTYNELLKLKGIGEYTAAAISSIAFGERKPAIDGNVKRVLSRLFGIYPKKKASDTMAMYRKMALLMMGRHKPGDFNQAMMDFGAIQCTPRNPLCTKCPLNANCYGFKMHKVNQLPVNKTTPALKKRYFNYFMIVHPKKIFLARRKSDDIWPFLYELPLIETTGTVSLAAITASKPFIEYFGHKTIAISANPVEIKHPLSHQLLICRFYRCLPTQLSKLPNKFKKKYTGFTFRQAARLALPRPIDRFLTSHPDWIHTRVVNG